MLNICRNSFLTEKRLLQYRNPNITKAIHFTDGRSKVIYCYLSDLTCRIHYCRPFIFLAERARASVYIEREMVILARPLTIRGGNTDRKQKKKCSNKDIMIIQERIITILRNACKSMIDDRGRAGFGENKIN